MEENKKTCPLCLAPAKFSGADYGRRKNIVCANCTEFQITNAAERILMDGPEEWRVDYSKQAQKPPAGFRLVITAPDKDPATKQKITLKGEYVDISSLVS